MDTAVLFLVFNRPQHTARVFEAIRRARPARLYVAADGPRTDRPGERETCTQAREIATDVNWPCELKTLYRETNLGCRAAVSGASDWFFENEDEGIILEDDCLPHPSFFEYCETMLATYRDAERVMSIAGSSFARPVFARYDYSFVYYADMWGWATWKRAWRRYDANMEDWPGHTHALRSVLSSDKAARYWSDGFRSARQRTVDSWAYVWIWSVINAKGVAIAPHWNMIENIGFGSEATHTRKIADISQRRVFAFPMPVRHPAEIRRNRLYEWQINLHRLRIKHSSPNLWTTEKLLKRYHDLQRLVGRI